MRHLLGVLALSLVLCGAAHAEPMDGSQTSRPTSIREGPWAADAASLNAAWEVRDWPRLELLLANLRPKFRVRYGEASPPYAESMMLEGLMLYETNRGEAALSRILEAGRLYELALGPNHRDVAIAWHTYADAVIDVRGDGALDEASTYYRRAYEIRRQALGDSAIETVAVGTALANTQRRRAIRDNDESMFADAEAIALRGTTAALPEHGVDYLNAWEALSNVLLAQGRAVDAEAALGGALARTPWGQDETNPLRAGLLSLLADTLEAQGRHAEAAALRAQRDGSGEPI